MVVSKGLRHLRGQRRHEAFFIHEGAATCVRGCGIEVFLRIAIYSDTKTLRKRRAGKKGLMEAKLF